MDVTCERCSTAYEFDDALVSERGTTVKCTSCGHQFKVRRPQAAGAPERWLVRTIDGRELEFRALRELQASIAQATITRDDVLSRGGSRPRRLGSIAELEPFFASAGAAGSSHATSLGLGPRPSPATPVGGSPRPRAPRTSEVSIAIPLPRGPEADAAPSPFAQSPRRASVPPPPPRRSAPPPPLPGVVVPALGAPPLPGEGMFDIDESTRVEAREGRDDRASLPGLGPTLMDPRRRTDDVSAPTAPFEVGSVLDPVKVRSLRDDWASDQAPPLPPPPAPPPPREPAISKPAARPPLRSVPPVTPSVPIEASAYADAEPSIQDQHTASVPPLTPTPAGVRHSYSDDPSEPRFTQNEPRRSGAARWIVGFVVVGMLGLVGATVGKKLLLPAAPTGTSASDARLGGLLADGEKNLADGDLESAKEQFDKASVLGEKDPRTVADLARLAAARADVDWLRVRLLAADDPELPTARRELEQAAQRARKAADRAVEVAPGDPAVMRSHIDALRLGGDLAGARKLVAGIATASAQPDNALALAELDLSEAKPEWPTVVGRLRSALATDGSLGRARSMLVYALARAGDGPGARSELDRLGALPRPHPLVGALKLFVARSGANIDPTALPDASAKPAAGKPSASAVVPGPMPGQREPREPRERPAAPERPFREPPTPEPHTPAVGPVDTSDLPGVKAPPTPPPTPTATQAPTPPPTPTAPPVPPGVDTSDLPGFK
jgi:predicted Zn finger-like uncharacterized protein